LAIELAAARVKLLPPPALLARLSRRLALLTGGARDLPIRQQTLRRTIEWSYALLGPAERRLFVRLAVFAGGFSPEAAERVCAGTAAAEDDERAAGLPAGAARPPAATEVPAEPLHAEEVLGLVASLLDMSLLKQQEDQREPRYVMLETIREYASERLTAGGEEPLLRQRHAVYYTTLALAAESELRGPQQAAWLDRLEAEHANIREALRWWAERAAAGEDGAATHGLRLGGALWRFWQVRGYLAEARQQLAALLALPPPAERSPAYLAARAEACFGSAVVGASTATGRDARQLLEESLALWRDLGDDEGVAYALQNLGELDLFVGNLAPARLQLQESAVLFRRLGDRRGLAWTLAPLGFAVAQSGEEALARYTLDESLATMRELGERRGVAIALICLAMASERWGGVSPATAAYQEAVSILWELRDRPDLAWALAGYAGLAAVHGDAERAVRLAAAATAERDALGMGAWRFPSFRDELDRRLALARRVLGDAGFAAAWAEGSEIPLGEAAALALEAETFASVETSRRPGAAAAAVSSAVASAVPAGGPPPWAPLTERERQVAVLVAQGLSNRQIAERLIITTNTAGVHVVHILDKLGLHSRAQIAAWVVARGLLPAQ
jgi:non-specific serine/threonine protein kinase